MPYYELKLSSLITLLKRFSFEYHPTMSAKMSQDAKKDEFRKYLEKAGVLELLTKSLVQLYEEPEKPSDGLSYMKKAVGGSPADKELIASLQKENDELKAKVSQLEAKQSKLQESLAELEKKSEQVKEAVPAEADAQVEANTGNTSGESAAAPAEGKDPVAAAAAPTTAATEVVEEKVPVESSSEAMGATTEEKTEEPMETESSSATPMETKSDPPTGDAPAEPTQE